MVSQHLPMYLSSKSERNQSHRSLTLCWLVNFILKKSQHTGAENILLEKFLDVGGREKNVGLV